jgi:Flp pilus assembly protein TadD
MGIAILALFISALAVSSASAQTAANEVPALCRPDATGFVDYQACVDAAPAGSPARILALINLGTQAYQRQDYAEAVRLYDEAQPPSPAQIYSDASFHAYRGDAYNHVGRTQEALANARTAWLLLSNSPEVAPEIRAEESRAVFDPEVVYGLILPILETGHDPYFAAALAAYSALPSGDWQSHANRAATLDNLGDQVGARRENTQALAAQPDNPQVLNTQCYVLAELNRGHEALPYCERVVQMAPDMSAVHDSYAVALAADHQCDAAQRERATARRLDPVSVELQQPLSCRPLVTRPIYRDTRE